MKAATRISSLIVFFIFSLFLLQNWTPLRIKYRQATGTLPKRLIIFGNAWSNPSSRQPTVWTTPFCTKLNLDCTNFSTGGNLTTTANSTDIGAIDSLLYNTTAPDLRSQVNSFLVREKASNAALNLPSDFHQKSLTGRSLPSNEKGLFVFSFGLTEIYQLSGPGSSRKAAEATIHATIDMLFTELETLALAWPEVLQAIVFLPIDVSLLPIWKRERQPIDFDGHMQRMAWELRGYWNKELEFRAAKWPRGEVLLWDVGEWHAGEYRDGKKAGWSEVMEGCGGVEGCEKVDGEHLMWDDVLIGPRAQGRMADRLIEALW